MFGLTYSTKQSQPDTFLEMYDDSYLQNITHISPMMWGEHCVECGEPQCYKTCSLYSKRIDGRCKRFRNGIEKIQKSSGLYSYAVKIECLRWGKLGAVLLPNCLPKQKILRQNYWFDYITSFVKAISSIVPISFFKKMDYYLKEFITRTEGMGKNYPDELLIEISNPDYAYDLIIEDTGGSRTRISVKSGFNRFHIPFAELNYISGIRNFLSITPQNEGQTLYIHTLDFVKIRKEISNRQDTKIKCVVWDLDNTLWEGILSEDNEVKLRQDIVTYIKMLDEKGVLNSISSKNDYNEAYKKLEECNIVEYFLYPQINWHPKSNSIQAIAKSLNIGLDTFMFIDDSIFELAEVSSKLPMVKCYNISDVEAAMNTEALKIEISTESKTRRQSYREIEKRNSAEQVFGGNIDDFLCSCEMQLIITKPNDITFARCLELINRTNQLNCSGERIPSDVLHTMAIDTDRYLCLQMNCVDKFGDYGIIGFCVINISDKARAVCEHFVLSCRAARKKIEQSFIEFIISYFRDQGFEYFAIRCTATPKNGQLLSILSELDFFVKKDINNKKYILEVLTKQKIKKIQILNIIENF
ncbi:MAG: HAD-IIIC family phosphatase [Bacteroidales bacterium]|jgi:FkbH-like protein|nr:HAD-IIIC family phosphatase [Bacteroidales bacterium]